MARLRAPFLRATAWKELAENLAESLTRGMAVVVLGALRQRSYETKDGERRTVVELEAYNVAASLKWSTARVTKRARSEATYGAPNMRETTNHTDAPPF